MSNEKFKARPGEDIIFEVRKHPAVLFRPILYLTLFSLLPVSAFIFFKFPLVFLYAVLVWLFCGGIYIFNVCFGYFKTQYILTTERLLGFEQKNLFHKSTLEIPLSKIQDARVSIKGFWSSIWDFGTIYVSSSLQEKVALHQVEEPEKLKEEIMGRVSKDNKVDDKKKIENFWN